MSSSREGTVESGARSEDRMDVVPCKMGRRVTYCCGGEEEVTMPVEEVGTGVGYLEAFSSMRFAGDATA